MEIILAKQQERIKSLEAEMIMLKQQINDMCHDKHVSGPVTAEEFCKGCEQFQMSLFGRSPITELKSELKRADREIERLNLMVEMMNDSENTAKIKAVMDEFKEKNTSLLTALQKAISIVENELDYRPDDTAGAEWAEVKAAAGDPMAYFPTSHWENKK